jgi:hypothetical protein
MKKIPHRLSLYLSKIVLCTQMDNGLPLNKVMLSTRVEELDEETIMMNILWGSSCTWIEVFSHLSLRVTKIKYLLGYFCVLILSTYMENALAMDKVMSSTHVK